MPFVLLGFAICSMPMLLLIGSVLRGKDPRAEVLEQIERNQTG